MRSSAPEARGVAGATTATPPISAGERVDADRDGAERDVERRHVRYVAAEPDAAARAVARLGGRRPRRCRSCGRRRGRAARAVQPTHASAPVDHRDAVVHGVRDPGELLVLGRLGGEQPRQLLLAGGEHVDAEALRLAHRPAACAPSLSKHTSSSSGSSDSEQTAFAVIPTGPARAVARDHRDAGREVAHHGAEAVGVDGLMPSGAVHAELLVVAEEQSLFRLKSLRAPADATASPRRGIQRVRLDRRGRRCHHRDRVVRDPRGRPASPPARPELQRAAEIFANHVRAAAIRSECAPGRTGSALTNVPHA